MRIAALLLLACALRADAFDLTTQLEQIPESNPVTRYRVSDGKTQFSFIAPFGWTTTSDATAKRVALLGSGVPRGAISIQILTNGMPHGLGQLRHEATIGLQSPIVTDEFKAPSGGSSGFGLDVRYLANGHPLMMRVCVFKTPEGSVELKLSGSPDDWGALHARWTGFINSFRIEEPKLRKIEE